MSLIEIIISILLLIGGGLTFIGSIGILRFPDVYGRLHAATKSATLGVISIMFATFFYFWFTHDIFVGKLLLTILFVFLTAPVAAFMVSKAAYNTGIKMSDKNSQDDLAIAMREHEKKNKQEKSNSDV
ncbi:monovalent cation/H(+) antiporter subunit G [Salipaludibacillus sp. CF4.18]|uniref:monovalent cation/H(+) antiporter subunit G n=1 Tax=Salipaludibacillus sp. CF4.18 TaxID=3373081 RepID=UPI003EE81EFD